MPLRDDESRRAGGSSMALRAAFPATIPVMTGFLCLGTAYGLLMQSKGYGPGWSVLMSAIAFGGSMQFVAVTLLTTAFDPVQAFLLSVMVNARHMFYGLSLLDKVPRAEARRALEERQRLLEEELAGLERGERSNEGRQVPAISRLTIGHMFATIRLQMDFVAGLLAALEQEEEP